MTTLQENTGELVSRSELLEVYGNKYDRTFTVHSKLFGRSGVAHAYATPVQVGAEGHVDFMVRWKSDKCRDVRWPHHFLRDGILFAFKANKWRQGDAFALTHGLFSLEWDASVILHYMNNKPFVFIASRGEWMEAVRIRSLDERPLQFDEEAQVFMGVPDHRRVPARVSVVEGKEWARSWADDCDAFWREHHQLKGVSC